MALAYHYECNAAEGKYTVHQTLDIAGRPVIITDAKGRPMTTNTMGMANPLKTTNIDSGSRWIVNDVAGKPLYMWDSRNHQIKHTYDQLQRPLEVILTKSSTTYVVEKTEYGESTSLNNIGQVQYIYDQSGKQEIESYDFKGNPFKTIKQFCENYQSTINWEATPAPTLKTETFIQQITYDALNRPVTQTLPDTSTQTNTYNKAGLLETVAKDSVLFVTNINYNEKGQRTDIYYGNGSKTRYYYNPLNFRLTRLLTTRNTGQDILQDLNYTYDPVGNIVEVVDNAQQIHYFSNSVIEPRGMYKYDALYRSVEATGRELTSLQLPTHEEFPNNIAVSNAAANAMQNYTQQYQYDQLGNILQMKSVGKWTRDYFYNTQDNKLLGHTNGVTEYTYDNHGNITSMPHLTTMNWDYKDQLLGATNGTFSSYYVYDSSGNRTRKVVVKGNIVEERYYFGNYEVIRKTTNGTLDFERKTIHISDDKKKIATVETKTGETEVVRYQYDIHLGSASLELDENAAIISYEEYHPFGTTSYRSGRTETEVSLKRYKYVGKERDEETGLYYYGARYYASWICRFVSVDPIAGERSWVNPYNYVQNNPANRVDPTGMLDEDPPQGEIDFISNVSGKYLGTFTSDTIKSYTVRSIDKTDFNDLKKQNFKDSTYEWGTISISESSKEVQINDSQIVADINAIYNKKSEILDKVRQTREGAIYFVWDAETNTISSRLQADTKNNYKTAFHEATEQVIDELRIASNPKLKVFAEMHTHETVPLDAFKVKTMSLDKGAINEDVNGPGMSLPDKNFMIDNGNIPLYAIDKIHSKSVNYGNIYGIKKDQSYEDTNMPVMHINNVLINPLIFIKDAIRKNQ